MKKYLPVILCLGLIGCATVPTLNSVSIGMTKADVIKIMGTPASVSAQNNTEYLIYSCKTSLAKALLLGALAACPGDSRDKFVRLVNGKVESYGNVGDFDSTKNPTVDINANIKTESK